MRQLWPICTRLSIFVPAPITVSSTLPRSTVVRDLAGQLAPSPLAGDVTEPVAPQTRAGVQNHAAADDHAAVAHDLRVQPHVIPHLHPVAEHAPRADANVL